MGSQDSFSGEELFRFGIPLSRRRFLRGLVESCVALSACGLAGCTSRRAVAPARVPVIGVLGFAPPRLLNEFKKGLHELGYIEGQSINVETRLTRGQDQPLRALARELVDLKVDILVSGGTQATQAARETTTSIPIVMAVSGDAVNSGFVSSLARPGGNVTGLTISSYQISAKRLELLKEIVPGISRVGALWNPTNLSHGPIIKSLNEAGATLGIRLRAFEVRRGEDFQAAFAAAKAARSQAVITLGDQLAVTHRSTVVTLATKRQLPAMYEVRDFVDVGGLIAFGANLGVMFRRAASFVDKILKGANPRDLPVEQPTHFELVVNLKAAQSIGLTIPQSVLARADEVIQ